MNRTVGAGVAVALVAFLVYLPTACPTIFAGDSGELATAAATLGIAHPPGYPIWTLLGNVFVRAIPGEPAWALNLFSALAAALAAGLLTVTLSMWSGRWLVAAGVGLAFAFSRAVWGTAVVTEVYALNLFFTMAALAAAVAARRGPTRLFGLAAYVLGLGVANHPFVLLAGLPVAALVLAPNVRRPQFKPLAQLPALALFFVLGASAYLYLPVRLGADPLMNWGGLQSFSDIIDHVMRAQYGGLGAESADASFAVRLRVFVGVVAASVPAPLWIVGAAGLVALFRAGHSRRALLLLGFFLLAGPVTAGAIRFDDTFLDRTVVTPFFLPAVLALFLLVGVAFTALEAWLIVRFREQERGVLIATGALAIVPALLLGQANHGAVDRSESTLARDYALLVLEQMPPDAMLFASGDNATFSLYYVQHTLGVRPDVAVMDRTLNLNVAAYGEEFLAMTRPNRKASRDARELQLIFQRRERPVFFTEHTQAMSFEGCRVAPIGYVAQLLRPGERAIPLEHNPGPLAPVDPDDFLEAHFAGANLYHEGLWYAESGDADAARDRYRTAARVARRIPSLVRNVGLAYLELGDLDEAEGLFLRTVEMEPRNRDALYNLAVLYSSTGRGDASLTYFERLDALGEDAPEVALGFGVELVRVGRLEEAQRQAERVISLAPDLEAGRTLAAAVARGREVGGATGVLEAQGMLGSLTAAGTLQLAQWYLGQGNMERATALYRDAAAEKPQSIEAAYGLGYGLLQAGHYEDAAEAFRSVLTIDPQSADGRNALAFIFAQTGDSLAKAEKLVQEALELSPDLAAYWNDTLGWVRYRSGSLEPALDALRLAEQAIPTDDSSTRAENEYHTGSVLMGLGRTNEAKDYFRRSAEWGADGHWVPDLEARMHDLGISAEKSS